MGDIFNIKKFIKNNSGKSKVTIVVIVIILLLIAIGSSEETTTNQVENLDIVNEENIKLEDKNEELDKIPAYKGSPYFVINNNNPFFYDTDLVTTSYEKYSDLDTLRKMRHCNCLYRERFNAN